MPNLRIWCAISVAVLCAACASPSSQPASATSSVGPRAEAKLEPRSGSSVEGTVRFSRGDGELLADVDVRGLPPDSEHGFHIHEKGDCSAPDAASAGGHFDPTGQPHGRPGGSDHHLGDLPNLRSDASGVARTELRLPGLAIVGGPNSVVGRALVVHRDPDDYESQPAGNSGPRIACGVIVAR